MKTYRYTDAKKFEELVGSFYKKGNMDTEGALHVAIQCFCYGQIKDILVDTINLNYEDLRIDKRVRAWAAVNKSKNNYLVGTSRLPIGLIDMLARSFIKNEQALLQEKEEGAYQFSFSNCVSEKSWKEWDVLPVKLEKSGLILGLEVESVTINGEKKPVFNYAIYEEGIKVGFEERRNLPHFVTAEDLDASFICTELERDMLLYINSYLEERKREIKMNERLKEIAEIGKVDVDVVKNIDSYLKDPENSLSNYTLLEVWPKSNHPEDAYLFMVGAKNTTSGEYAVWTSWNESLKSLNNGHYNLQTKEEMDKTFDEYFHNAYKEYGISSEKARDLDFVNEFLANRRASMNRGNAR